MNRAGVFFGENSSVFSNSVISATALLKSVDPLKLMLHELRLILGKIVLVRITFDKNTGLSSPYTEREDFSN